MIGTYPTPVELLDKLSTGRTRLWIKRDDLTAEAYGGNKVRKLEHLLELARRRGKKRVVTVGAAGSHQALATAIHAQSFGLPVTAILAPHPRSEHALTNLRAAVGLGIGIVPAMHAALVPLLVARVLRPGDFFIGPGGSSALGTLGYIDAAAELAAQIARGDLPRPDVIVVGIGSGGTAAGLLAGLSIAGMNIAIAAARVVEPLLIGPGRTIELARKAARIRGVRLRRAALRRTLQLETGYLGAGYGYPTEQGMRAMREAASAGLELDPTYTAKVFACALDRVARGEHANVLYWHTLSSAPLDSHLDRAPSEADLPRRLVRLLRT